MFRSFSGDMEFKKIYNAEELAKKVKDSVEYYENRADRLHEANMELREDAKNIVRHEYEDKIKSLENQLHLSWGEFASEKELEAYHNFTKKHTHNRMYSKVNGGLIPYIIPNYTRLGCIKRVVCQICDESEDITDTEVW